MFAVYLTWKHRDSSLIHDAEQAWFHRMLSMAQLPTAPKSSSSTLPLLPITTYFWHLLCAGTTWLHAATSTHSATSVPAQELVLVTLSWLVWQKTRVMSTGLVVVGHSQGELGLMSTCPSLLSAVLPFPSCWYWCSWSYTVGQMRNQSQLKANTTVNQKNTWRCTVMGIVLSPSSVCTLQTPLLEERQKHSTRRARKQS